MNYGIFLAWVVLPAWFLAAAVLGLLSELGALGTRLRRTKSLGLLISIGTPVPMAVHVPFLTSLHLATGMALLSLVMAWEPGRIAGEAMRVRFGALPGGAGRFRWTVRARRRPR